MREEELCCSHVKLEMTDFPRVTRMTSLGFKASFV